MAVAGSSGDESRPVCSVVMPVRRLDAFVPLAVDSVRAQTMLSRDPMSVELVAVLHDGSDEEAAALQRLVSVIPRGRLVRSLKATVPDVRNDGIAVATGRYYAVLDADDLMHAERLERQVAHLEANQGCSAVGAWASIIDGTGDLKGISRPRSEVRFSYRHGLFFQPALFHSGLMCRMSDVKRLKYSRWFRAAHDQELLLRLSDLGKLMNLQQVLLSHRKHDGERRISNRMRRFQSLAIVRLAQIVKANIRYSEPLDVDPVIKFGLQPEAVERGYFNWLYKMNMVERQAATSGMSLAIVREAFTQTARSVARRHVGVWTAVMFALRFVLRIFR